MIKKAYVRGADPTEQKLADFKPHIRKDDGPFGWDSVESSMRKTVSDWAPCTCIETQADENGKVWTRLCHLGGDESVLVYELNAIRAALTAFDNGRLLEANRRIANLAPLDEGASESNRKELRAWKKTKA